MTPRRYKKGEILFRKGDVANEMFLTVTGKFLVTEIGIELPPGRIMQSLFAYGYERGRAGYHWQKLPPGYVN